MSTNTLASNRWSVSFFAIWVVVTAIAVAVGQLGAMLLSWDIGDAVEGVLGQGAAIVVVGVMIGIGIGGFGATSQALLLRGQVDAKRWIGGALVGAVLAMCVGMALIIPASDTMSEWLSGLVAGVMVGLGVGVGQWVALRKHLSGINRWVIASGLGYAVSVLLLFGTGGEGREMIALASSGLAFGLISGFGLWWAGIGPKT